VGVGGNNTFAEQLVECMTSRCTDRKGVVPCDLNLLARSVSVSIHNRCLVIHESPCMNPSNPNVLARLTIWTEVGGLITHSSTAHQNKKCRGKRLAFRTTRPPRARFIVRWIFKTIRPRAREKAKKTACGHPHRVMGEMGHAPEYPGGEDSPEDPLPPAVVADPRGSGDLHIVWTAVKSAASRAILQLGALSGLAWCMSPKSNSES
jgi:hypothetical protein